MAIEVQKRNLNELLGNNTRYEVPLFQRAYSWNKEHWRQLWQDILYQREHTAAHFMGAIVTKRLHTAAGFNQWMLIDGQQRLATLLILLVAIRDNFPPQSPGFEEIKQLLTNPFRKNQEYYKLILTELHNDNQILTAIIDSGNPANTPSDSPLIQAYQYYNTHIQKLIHKNTDTETVLHEIKELIIFRLIFISVSMDDQENEYLIFESLNNRGMSLKQTDLIRNYLLSKLRSLANPQELYQRYWLPVEETLVYPDPQKNKQINLLEDFFFRWLIAQTEKTVNQKEIFTTLTEHYQKPEQLLDIIYSLPQMAAYYKILEVPELEPHPELRKRLSLIHELDIRVIFTFLIRCYHDYQTQKLSLADFCQVLEIIENYLVRCLVCKEVAGINKWIPTLYRDTIKHQEFENTTFVQALKHILGTKQYPTDKDFRRALREKSFEGLVKLARFLLARRNDYRIRIANPQHPLPQIPYQQYSLEHIMPQTLSKEWQDALGNDAFRISSVWANRLANLTLTTQKLNAQLSNRIFREKKQLELHKDAIRMNAEDFADISSWNETTLTARTDKLVNDFLAIYPRFIPEQPYNIKATPQLIKPAALYCLNKKTDINSWAQLWIQTVETTLLLQPENYKTASKLIGNYYIRQTNTFRRAKELSNQNYLNINFSRNDILRLCKRWCELCNWQPSDWYYEDEAGNRYFE